MRALAILCGAALLCAAISVRAQQTPQTTFRAGVEIVDVDVTVLDKHRLPVRGLTAKDFTVLEDGREREIVAFSPVDLPPRELPPAPWMADVAPDVQSNQFPREGRLLVILMDRSISPPQLPEARRVAEAAVSQLGAGDLGAVVFPAYGVPQNFTADRRRLLSAIRQPLAGLPAGDSGDSGECFCGACSIETIANVAEAIQDVRQRRKVLFFIGSNLRVQSSGTCSGVITDARTRVLRAAEAGNLTIYSFDTTGLETLAPGAAVSRPGPTSAMGHLIRQGNLMTLPDHTGGRTIFGNAPSEKLPEVFRESSSYYILGFHPSHTDAKFHEIRIRTGLRDVTLQARRGYYAEGSRAPAPTRVPKGLPPTLHAAVSGMWPSTTLPLTLSAAPLAAPGLRAATVVLVIGVGPDPDRVVDSAPPAALAAPSAGTTLNVLAGAFDRNGMAFGWAQQSVAVRPRSASAPPFPYEVISRLELKPGRYEIRAGVEDASSGRTGSVYTYVDVPDFVNQFVSLSGIFLQVDPVRAEADDQEIRDLLPLVPTGQRDFARTDRVTAFLQVYQGLRRAAMPGYVTAEIRDSTDTRVYDQETRTLASDVGNNRAMNMSFPVPVGGLAPGEYLFSIDVRQGTATAHRDVRFRIR